MQPVVSVVDLQDVVEASARWGEAVIEAAGIAVILVGALLATISFLRRVLRGVHDRASFERYRRGLGHAILLGLEFLVAADIIGTVLVHPTFRNLGVLAVLVAIRTFLSFTLTVEIEQRWPWQTEGARSGGDPDASS